MSNNVLLHAHGFAAGLSRVLRLGGDGIGIGFSILRLGAGEIHSVGAGAETAILLLSGTAEIGDGHAGIVGTRGSLFDDEPYAFHCCASSSPRIVAGTGCELAIIQAENRRAFPSKAFAPADCVDREKRGKGRLDDAAFRIVRTIFDDRNRPEGDLVLGEVVNFPGRWSSYPPHHHPQPEVYHYRFTDERGYGHAELGENVHKVRQGDTLLIQDELDHPQVAAPGYGMWYLWAIRHLPGRRYGKPEFSKDHAWLNSPVADFWKPRNIEGE